MQTIATRPNFGLPKIPKRIKAKRIGQYHLFHDIGKILLPTIISKSGRLTEQENHLLRKHPELGAWLLKKLGCSAATLDCVRYHHERWDGGGEAGLSGLGIPIEARLVALADSWDGATATLSKCTWDRSQLKGIHRLKKRRGRELDPQLVELFLDQHVITGATFAMWEKEISTARNCLHNLFDTYKTLNHPVVYVQSRYLDDLTNCYHVQKKDQKKRPLLLHG
jgi:hypothetical protein